YTAFDSYHSTRSYPTQYTSASYINPCFFIEHDAPHLAQHLFPYTTLFRSNMGAPMAANLLKAGYTLRVFDLMPEAVAKLTSQGAQAAASAIDAARDADIVISMLPSSPQVEALYLGKQGLLAALEHQPLIIDF